MIKVEDVSHVAFLAPDLNQMEAFLNDFGLRTSRVDQRLYARGLGPAPYLHTTELGEPGLAAIGFRASSVDDVEALGKAERVPPQQVERPGGGVMVTLVDPDGFLIEVIAGQQFDDGFPFPESVAWNSARRKGRLRDVRRTGEGASRVVRLGHCVLSVSNFRRAEAWYKERFGFITSDEIAASDDVSVGAFMRCDRGDIPTDHHSLFLVEGPQGVGFHHAAFEVLDLDDLMRGHERLKASGRAAHWGVGRHVLGSQVFDYWRDPWGNTLEHWTDGDLFTAADGSRKAPLSDLLALQWGPAPPMAS